MQRSLASLYRAVMATARKSYIVTALFAGVTILSIVVQAKAEIAVELIDVDALCGGAVNVNERNTIIIDTCTSHGFIKFNGMPSVSITDRSSIPWDINDLDQVAGTLQGAIQTLFFWSLDTGVLDLGTPVSGQHVFIPRINDLGEIVFAAAGNVWTWSAEAGFANTGATGLVRAFNDVGQILTNDSGVRSWVVEKDEFGSHIINEITLSGASLVDAQDMNNRGQAVGRVLLGDLNRAFLWDKSMGTETIPSTLPSGFDHAMASLINDAGDVAMVLHPADFSSFVFGVWNAEQGLTIIPPLPFGTPTACLSPLQVHQSFGPLAIDGFGRFVGSLDLSCPVNEGTFRDEPWDTELQAGLPYIASRANGLTLLPVPDVSVADILANPDNLVRLHGRFNQAVAINDRGTVVGSVATSTSDQTPALWQVSPPRQNLLRDLLLIQQQVDQLFVAGVLSEGEATAISASLQVAANRLNDGNRTAACNTINATSKKIEAKVRSGRITLAEAQPILEATAEVASSVCQ